MPIYHFDLGDSGRGPIGMCAEVRADNEDQALAYLAAFLDENSELNLKKQTFGDNEEIEYCNVYISPDNITTADIDEVTPDEDDEPVTHEVRLSNGQTIVLREGENRLHLGQQDTDGTDWWLADISGDGILAAPNSGSAPQTLTEGLRGREGQAKTPQKENCDGS